MGDIHQDGHGNTVIEGRQVKFAIIDDASADNTLVSAVTGKKLRVHSLFLINGHTSTQTIRFQSGTGNDHLTGQMILAANGGFVLPFSEVGWFETQAGAVLNMELGGTTTVDGGLTYTEV